MVNVVPAVQSDLGISMGTLNIAISVTALFSGMFIVAAGGLADKAGRKKIAYIGFVLSIIGSLCLVLAEGAPLLIAGRIIQGLSAACIMPSTILGRIGRRIFCRRRHRNESWMEMDFYLLYHLRCSGHVPFERYTGKQAGIFRVLPV